MDVEERYMWMALDLARQGFGKTNPNPMVGAVLVKDGEVVGTGYHEKAGQQHAEIVALREAGEKARGSVLYINLEPCSHHGRTPPCVDAIIEAGVRKVVISTIDPNPLVGGEGVRKLRQAGIKVKTGVLEDKARRLNEVFLKYITTKKPFIAVKAALTLDGKIASSSGESKWITGEGSRKLVHRLRSTSDGIMVGINTVLKDDPRLTARIEGEEVSNPVRIIVDSKGRIPLDSKVVKTASEVKTLLATTELADETHLEELSGEGVEVIRLPNKEGRVDLEALMHELGRREISVVLVEGGGSLNYSLLENHLVDKIYFFMAPLLLGGKDAPTPLEGAGADALEHCWSVKDLEIKQVEGDLLVTGYPVRREKVVHRDSRGVG